MNKDNIRTWIHALESGKYLQGSGHLHWQQEVEDTDCYLNEYCCLGVACVLADLEPTNMVGSAMAYGLEEQTGLAPRETMEWLGLRHIAGVGGDVQVIDNVGNVSTVSSLNDRGLSFKEIAALLRREFDITD